MAAARARHRRRARRIDPERLLSSDEMGASTDMARLCGWCRRGERLVEAAPAGHWQTTTLLQAVGVRGVRAAMLTDGPTNATVFEDFVTWLLAPAPRPGDVVLLDNLSSHKAAGALGAIAAADAEVWFLPPYSPDLDPIENICAKVKQLLRQAKARCTTALYDAVAEALRHVTAADCRNCFRSCGYAATRNVKTL